MDKKKLARLMALDAKRGIADKILIMIEIVVCIVLLATALSGVFGANHIRYLYRGISGLLIDGFQLQGMSEDNVTALNKRILKEENIGKIELVTGAFGRGNNMAIYGYNDKMLEVIPIELNRGEMFSENYQTEQYREIILGYNFSSKFKIGDFVSDGDIGTIGENNYKVIGFLQNNYGILDHQYNVAINDVGIIKIDLEDDISGTIVFANESPEEFMRKYEVYDYFLQDIEDGISRLRITTTAELLEDITTDFQQVMSFFIMFLVIALGVYFTTIMSSIVIKHNDNLLYNKNMVRIGVTRKEFLFVRLVNILLISLLCVAISMIILVAIVAPNITALAQYATMSAEVILTAIAIVIASYAAIEIGEVLVMLKFLKKERK